MPNGHLNMVSEIGAPNSLSFMIFAQVGSFQQGEGTVKLCKGSLTALVDTVDSTAAVFCNLIGNQRILTEVTWYLNTKHQIGQSGSMLNITFGGHTKLSLENKHLSTLKVAFLRIYGNPFNFILLASYRSSLQKMSGWKTSTPHQSLFSAQYQNQTTKLLFTFVLLARLRSPPIEV